MTNTRNLIIQLKEVRKEKGNLSYTQITKKIEDNGGYPPSKATLSRVFADGSEDEADSFSYEKTLMPIANAILDVDIDDNDDMDTKALKALVKSKKEHIELLEEKIAELKASLDKEKISHHEKLEKKDEEHRRSIEFLKEQIAYKDKRMDFLLDAVQKKDKLHVEMLERILKCSGCEKYENRKDK